MKSCRSVSSNDTFDEIYQKAADMVSTEEISMPCIVQHQTMRSNVPADSPKNLSRQPLLLIFGLCHFAVRSTIFWSY